MRCRHRRRIDRSLFSIAAASFAVTISPRAFAEGDLQPASPNVGLFRLPAHRGGADALAGPEGFGFLSKDNDFGMMLHWVLQADGREELAEVPSPAARSTFVARFAGFALTARFYERIRSELLVNFAQSQLSLSEAWVDAEAATWLHFKAGKFHYPISLERITTGIFFPLVDAGLTSVLLPSADTGVQAWGRFGDGLLEYNIALVNGAVAGGSDDQDVDVPKDIVARVLAQPFKNIDAWPIRHLAFGIGAMEGIHRGSATSPELPVLTTWGGLRYFAFRNDGTKAGTVVATGGARRIVPQATWNAGPLSAYAEYVRGGDEANQVTVESDAMGVVATAVLTGEPSIPLHYVVPRHNFSLSQGHWGALELTGSAGSLRIQPGAALNAVAPQSAARLVRAFAAGLNWYPNLGVRVMVDVSRTTFDVLPGGSPLPDESLLVGRFQVVL